eukprot:scaffold32214_cov61-Phaeocystis_antarctica.AAC.10
MPRPFRCTERPHSGRVASVAVVLIAVATKRHVALQLRLWHVVLIWSLAIKLELLDVGHVETHRAARRHRHCKDRRVLAPAPQRQ